ncbi:MAG: undecaprenyl/decaprenyl-phosphate alpha-N-acetylglucosaminyl 1-phosphate transferase [Anaerolineales bacterium]|nr:undecaprenyl/decaprenyl-phosphate alpha-N-acetylglucosaminyl 1-phosphate transferase [Anaerolineales bacterium]
MSNAFLENNLLLPFLTSLLASFGFSIPCALLAQKLGIVDIPNSAPHKKHSRPTPLAGGFLIVCSFILSALLFRAWLTTEILAIFSAAFVIFIFGLWDDIRRLFALQKLLGQILAATILIVFGVQVHFVANFAAEGYFLPSSAEFLNLFITYFWLIGITNAFNMIDSMDGIVAGLGAIASAFFMIATYLAGQSTLAFWSAILLGVNIALYFWNGIKSRFFLGDSGAQTIGFLLASMAIMYNPLDRNPTSSWIVPIMLLSAPIFDTTLVVISRIRKKQPIGNGRRDHTYHRLIALGLSQKYAVLVLHTSAFLVSCLAFITLQLSPSFALTFFLIASLAGFLALLWLSSKQTLDE